MEQRHFVPQHSLFGIASTVVGVTSVLALCGGAIAVVMVASSVADNQWNPAADRKMMLSFVSMLCGAPLSLVGIGLGIGGFFETGRQKPFAILGTVVNGAVLLTYLCALATIVIGVSSQ